MKLLVISRDYRSYVYQFVEYLLEELAKLTELYVWHERGCDVRDIIQQLKVQPDFVFVIEYLETNASNVSGLSLMPIPYAVSLHDLHTSTDFRRNRIAEEKVPYIFSPCRDAFHNYFPEFADRFIWFPNYVNTELFFDYGQERDIDYLLMGHTSPVYYPLRHNILNTMQGKPGFVYHHHPGYREIGDSEGAFIKEKYAREISRAKIFFTCGGIGNYPVAKYFEVLACKTLLLAASFPELEDLGFVSGETFVAVDSGNFLELAEYYLHHEKERLRISEQGYEMVHERHSASRRAKELVDAFERIIEQESCKNQNK